MIALNLIYAAVYAVVAVSTLAALIVVWPRRASRDAVPLAGLMLGVAIWCGASSAMWYAPTLSQQVFWNRFQDLGVWTIPGAFLALALVEVGYDARRIRRWVAVVSVVLANLEWINPGDLFDAAFAPVTIGPYTSYTVVPGPLYRAPIAFIYVVVLTACMILSRVYLKASGIARKRAAILLAVVPIDVVSSSLKCTT